MENVDEIWNKASERFPTSTTAWLKNCAGGDLDRAKRVIVDALIGGDSTEKNILRPQQKKPDNDSIYDNDDSSSSSSSNGSSSDEADAAVTLLRLMTEQARMTSLIASYLNDGCANESAVNASSRGNHVLHVAAQHGCISDLKPVIKPDQVIVVC